MLDIMPKTGRLRHYIKHLLTLSFLQSISVGGIDCRTIEANYALVSVFRWSEQCAMTLCDPPFYPSGWMYRTNICTASKEMCETSLYRGITRSRLCALDLLLQWHLHRRPRYSTSVLKVKKTFLFHLSYPDLIFWFVPCFIVIVDLAIIKMMIMLMMMMMMMTNSLTNS